VAAKAPGKISNVRGRGLMCAFDAASAEHRSAILKAALERRLILLPCGPRSIRLRPALNLTRAEVDEAMVRLTEALAAIP